MSGPVKLSTMEQLLFPVVDFVCVPLPEIGFLALELQVTLAVVLLSRTHTFPVKLVPLSYIGHWTTMVDAVVLTSHPLLLKVGVPPAALTQFDPGYTNSSSITAAARFGKLRQTIVLSTQATMLNLLLGIDISPCSGANYTPWFWIVKSVCYCLLSLRGSVRSI